jgi:hypothetical protein
MKPRWTNLCSKCNYEINCFIILDGARWHTKVKGDGHKMVIKCSKLGKEEREKQNPMELKAKV